jgi:hypothetical protein
VLASAIPKKPNLLKTKLPIGAPMAIAANIDMPTQAMTCAERSGATRPRPQSIPPVMIRLSAPPTNVRPASSMATDNSGAWASCSEKR